MSKLGMGTYSRSMTSVPSHITPLRLVQPAVVDLARAMPLLTDDAGAWLGTPVPAGQPGFRRYLTDLSLPIRDHAPSLVFKKAAFVDLGQLRETSERVEMEIGWRSSSLAPLFPVFSGHLVLTHNEMRLEGYYAPPGRELGAALDKAFLGIAARGTARWFLERMTEVVATAEVVANQSGTAVRSTRGASTAG
jgi:hypothetical protein